MRAPMRLAVACASFLLASVPAIAQAPSTAQVIQGEELELFLAKARTVRLRDIGTGVTASQRASLERDGVTHEAIFKTIDMSRPGASKASTGGMEFDFQDSWQTEIPAYVIDRILGLGMVPATVERSINGTRGSLQLWVESIGSEDSRRKQSLAPPDPEAYARLTFKMHCFDQLIANVDRHLNNILVTKEFELRLIDHSRAFRPVNELADPLRLPRFSRAMVDALPRLEFQDLRKRVGRYLSDRQLRALLQRRDAILALVKLRIAQQGEASVIFP